MRIVGHGIDIVALRTFMTLVNDPQSDFAVRCFTVEEMRLCEEELNRCVFLAGRYAAKEAVAKAMKTGFTREVSPNEIEVGRDEKRAPTIELRNSTAMVARALGITQWQISISHSVDAAIASAIAISYDT